MRRILVSALFLGASGLPALADPFQLLPGAFATHEGANGGAAVQAQPQPTAGRPRYAEPNQPQFGGGFIELLFGGAARQFVAHVLASRRSLMTGRKRRRRRSR